MKIRKFKKENILEQIALKNGVSIDEVRIEMQKTIEAAWDISNKTTENLVVQNTVHHDGSKPTPEELIQYCIQQAQQQRWNKI